MNRKLVLLMLGSVFVGCEAASTQSPPTQSPPTQSPPNQSPPNQSPPNQLPPNQTSVTEDATAPTTQTPSPTSDTPATASEIPLQVATWEEVQALIADRKGRVVVVDLWSTSCVPCLREFPGLVDLHSQYPEQVACLSVNLDYIGAEGETPEDHREKVLAFLTQSQATFANVICADSDEAVYQQLDLAAVPAVLVYDRQGTLTQRFDNDTNEYGEEGFTYADHVAPLVEQLLKD